MTVIGSGVLWHLDGDRADGPAMLTTLSRGDVLYA
jgi:hypothetical protein